MLFFHYHYEIFIDILNKDMKTYFTYIVLYLPSLFVYSFMVVHMVLNDRVFKIKLSKSSQNKMIQQVYFKLTA